MKNAEPVASHDLSAALGFLHDRRSVRAYTARDVPQALLAQLLCAARAAPSGANLQPGRFIQVSGTARETLSNALIHRVRGGHEEREDYGYFPRPMPMLLRKRQVAAAQALYGALGIARGDEAGRAAQFERNYRFFDAPVALVVTIDAAFGAGGYMDLGMALHGLQLAASAVGMGSCAIGALASHADTVRRVLDLPEDQHIVCGVALGWPDGDAPVNQTFTERAPLHTWFDVRDGLPPASPE
ncbi:nitroreductase [Diaphorobacter aerolatus]|uniref:Nitroreductase n=1 Tax=Diaphorobacter aerolatus TaxID=1288495 RepID=A0A7H0GL70_9BURK|nr:nitroreductase [Diaphorobacter aerolatus]QNP49036.1 nitroreductase [Diaphorobacter aerolatus]